MIGGADLGGAYLRGGIVHRFGCEFSRLPIQIGDKYWIELWDGFLKIGCEEHTIEDWQEFSDKRIIQMDGKSALEWWRIWKPILMNMAEETDRMTLPSHKKELRG